MAIGYPPLRILIGGEEDDPTALGPHYTTSLCNHDESATKNKSRASPTTTPHVAENQAKEGDQHLAPHGLATLGLPFHNGSKNSGPL